jgi:hypothetical protein
MASVIWKGLWFCIHLTPWNPLLLNQARSKAHFTLGVKANVQLKSSIPIGAKVEISPKGFTLGVKAEIEKVFSQ